MSTAQAPLEVGVRGRRFSLLRRAPQPASEGRAGPLVKLILLALCVLWMVPALGLLVTSIRDQDDASSSGWWNMFDSGQPERLRSASRPIWSSTSPAALRHS